VRIITGFVNSHVPNFVFIFGYLSDLIESVKDFDVYNILCVPQGK